ncbi:MAG: methyltransferase domain-containing protein [Desulfobacteraceae bacterium]|nr:methyltransferase domain-containing protein [Desulfobacteraceae bacterium]
MKPIYPNYSEPKFISQILFEINSIIGRVFFKKTSRIKPCNNPLLLDLGAGTNFKDGFTHVDMFRNRIRKFWKQQPPHRKPEIETDLRFPLNCPNDIVDGVYSGHTLEHLYPNHAYNLLKEIFRILKPGCWLRINVPDLKRAIDFYNGKIEINEYKYKAEAIGHLTQNWGHHSVWDEELLSKALELQGFVNIKKVEFGKEGTDHRLIKEKESRKHETLVIEAQKPE